MNIDLHPKNPLIGSKKVWRGPLLWVDQADARDFCEGSNVTFVHWGNLKVLRVKREKDVVTGVEMMLNLEDRDFKKTLKVTWLTADDVLPAEGRTIPVECRHYSHIINKAQITKDEDFKPFVAMDTVRSELMRGERALAAIKKGDIIQLQRRGFFICDQPYTSSSLYSGVETPLLLFSIPDGHTKDVPTGGARTASTATSTNKSAATAIQLHIQIVEQGDKIRDMKAAKTDKKTLQPEIDRLLTLKKEFKTKSGQDWKPDIYSIGDGKNVATVVSADTEGANMTLHTQIVEQGDKIRDMKAAKTDKKTLQPEIDRLLTLKKEFKTKSGQDWKPDIYSELLKDSSAETIDKVIARDLHIRVAFQHNRIMDMQTGKYDVAKLEVEMERLDKLKELFKTTTGYNWNVNILHSGIENSVVGEQSDNQHMFLQRKVPELYQSSAALPGRNLSAKALKDDCLMSSETKCSVVTGDYSSPLDVCGKATASKTYSARDMHIRIKFQSERVLDLKSSAESDAVKVQREVDRLAQMKEEYRMCTGSNWNP